jgi:hypothetical protein
MKYVFGPKRHDGVLIHDADCSVLDEFFPYRECPPEVLSLVQIVRPEMPYGKDRPVGLCLHCFRGEATS